MEHIVTIAINIDDDDIKAKIEDQIVREVTSKLIDNIGSYIINKYGGVNSVANRILHAAVGQYKKEIVDAAVKDVSISIKRSPKYKTVLNKIEKIGTELEEYYGS